MSIDFREREELRQRERNINLLSQICAPTGVQTQNLAMSLDQRSNSQPFGAQDNTPTNWATQPRNMAEIQLLSKQEKELCHL